MLHTSEREIAQDELAGIYEDFKAIEIADGVPQHKSERYSFVTEDGGKVVGFASGLTNHQWFYLTDLWVEQSHRRRGLGSSLLVRIESKAKAEGMKHIYLWTSGFINPQFYEKHGYHRFAVFEDFFEVEGYHHIGYRKDF